MATETHKMQNYTSFLLSAHLRLFILQGLSSCISVSVISLHTLEQTTDSRGKCYSVSRGSSTTL